MKIPKLPSGAENLNMYCKGQRINSDAFREGHERTFGKRPLPHGKALRDRMPEWMRRRYDEVEKLTDVEKGGEA